jgi:hypothetical protein
MVLSILRRVVRDTDERGNIPATQDNYKSLDEVDYLLRQLFTSNYSGGAFLIIRLCLVWMTYHHPPQQDILVRLRRIGSRPDFMFSPDALETPSGPAQYIGFADVEEDPHIGQSQQLLRPEDCSSQADAAKEYQAIFCLRKSLKSQKNLSTEHEHAAADLAWRVHLSITTYINVLSPDASRLSRQITDLAPRMYKQLRDVMNLVQSALKISKKGKGTHEDEELPDDRITRPSVETDILNQVIRDVEGLVNATFRAALLFSGLLAQARLLAHGSAVNSVSTELEDGMERLCRGLKTRRVLSPAGY